MNELKLEVYWNDIPVEKKDALSYSELKKMWNTSDRSVRQILHELSLFDNGDNYILIRSSRCKGFFKTDNIAEINQYKKECLNKGFSVLAPLKKINRVINTNSEQLSIENNMRVIREEKGLKQSEVCEMVSQYDKAIDKAMLSKMENSVCLPTPYQLQAFAKIYDCMPSELVNCDLYY